MILDKLRFKVPKDKTEPIRDLLQKLRNKNAIENFVVHIKSPENVIDVETINSQQLSRIEDLMWYKPPETTPNTQEDRFRHTKINEDEQ